MRQMALCNSEAHGFVIKDYMYLIPNRLHSKMDTLLFSSRPFLYNSLSRKLLLEIFITLIMIRDPVLAAANVGVI